MKSTLQILRQWLPRIITVTGVAGLLYGLLIVMLMYHNHMLTLRQDSARKSLSLRAEIRQITQTKDNLYAAKLDGMSKDKFIAEIKTADSLYRQAYGELLWIKEGHYARYYHIDRWDTFLEYQAFTITAAYSHTFPYLPLLCLLLAFALFKPVRRFKLKL